MKEKLVLNILLITIISIFTGCAGGIVNYTGTPLEKKFAAQDLKSTIKYLSTQDIKKLTYGSGKKNILQMALHKKFLSLANYIIDNNLVDINYIDLTGRNVLFEAVLFPSITKKLLDKGIDTKLKTKDGVTALHVAIASSITNKNIIKMLLDNGADVNAKTIDNNTAINFALYKKRIDIIDLLVDYNINLNNNKTILHFLADMNDISTMKKIINKGFDVNNKNAQGLTPLGLIFTNLAKNNKKTTPEILTLLITNGAKINVTVYGLGTYGNERSTLTERDFLTLAIKKNYKKIVKYLLSKNIDLNKKDKFGYSPLSYAVDTDNIDITKLLLSKDININTLNHQGLSYLHIAMGRSNLETVKLLVEKNINIFYEGDTASPLFVGYGLKEYPNIIKYLIEKGANLNDIDADGSSILSLAIIKKHSKLAEYLIEKGADIHILNSSGTSLLHLAVRADLPNIAKLLIKKGIDKSIVNKMGYTAFDANNAKKFKELGIL